VYSLVPSPRPPESTATVLALVAAVAICETEKVVGARLCVSDTILRLKPLKYLNRKILRNDLAANQFKSLCWFSIDLHALRLLSVSH
jgi:hypothetical protein